MARPPNWRRVEFIPNIQHFVPSNNQSNNIEENILKIEEIEAIRLKDVEKLEQEDCAERMEVSRQTFQRILNVAREKIADSIIYGKAIRIEGGKESGCFVVNLVSKEYKETFDYLGSHSKRDEDKLEKMKVRLREGLKVNAPLLEDCPVNIECTIVDSVVTGSHEMFVGKIEYVHANSSLVDSEGKINFSAIDFL